MILLRRGGWRARRHLTTATTLRAEMSAAEHEALLWALHASPPDFPGLEVGTAAGGTLCVMLKSLPPQRRRFVVVDRMRYFKGQLAAVKRNLVRHALSETMVDLRVASSARALRAAQGADERYGFVLLDAGHRLMDVLRDLRWSRLLVAGGALAIHDYDDSWSHRGVVVAVDRFLDSCPHFERVAHTGRLLILRKTEDADASEVRWPDFLYAGWRWAPLRLRRSVAKLRRLWTRRRLWSAAPGGGCPGAAAAERSLER